MKKICLYLAMLALSVLMVNCSEEKLDPNSVIREPIRVETPLDQWLNTNYVGAYNIDVQYRFADIQSQMNYNLIPADYQKSVQLAKVIHFLCLAPYDSVTGSRDFARLAFPKFLVFVGSGAHNNNGTVILGTAEDGIRVVMYQVNSWNTDVPPNPANFYPMSNAWNSVRYFHTLHHELGHILHQLKPYSQTFRAISATDYVQDDWSTVYANNPDGLRSARQAGFITQYSSKNDNEDFVELFSIYITSTQAFWNEALAQAGEEGGNKIQSKFSIMYDYMLNEWDIDLNELRRVIDVSQKQLETMDLNNLD
ncbi:MAG: putative zinc-binding metallopeptidase [Bacteroidales bacterium]|nr:putative zinc-binding metallopeptidase [Bacteroidales bacterium]